MSIARTGMRSKVVVGITFEFAAKTTNPLNNSQGVSMRGMHARRRIRNELRAKARYVTIAELRAAGFEPPGAIMPCVVTVRRVAPSNGLDEHDGLPAALKPIVDGIADALGLKNDRDARVTWERGQARGDEYAIEVSIDRVHVTAAKKRATRSKEHG